MSESPTSWESAQLPPTALGRLRWETKPDISIIHLQQQEIPQPGWLEMRAQEGEAIWEPRDEEWQIQPLKAQGDKATSGFSEAPDHAEVTPGTPKPLPAPQTLITSLPPLSSPAARWAEPQAASRGSRGGWIPAIHEAQPNPKNNVFIL